LGEQCDLGKRLADTCTAWCSFIFLHHSSKKCDVTARNSFYEIFEKFWQKSTRPTKSCSKLYV